MNELKQAERVISWHTGVLLLWKKMNFKYKNTQVKLICKHMNNLLDKNLSFPFWPIESNT